MVCKPQTPMSLNAGCEPGQARESGAHLALASLPDLGMNSFPVFSMVFPGVLLSERPGFQAHARCAAFRRQFGVSGRARFSLRLDHRRHIGAHMYLNMVVLRRSELCGDEVAIESLDYAVFSEQVGRRY